MQMLKGGQTNEWSTTAVWRSDPVRYLRGGWPGVSDRSALALSGWAGFTSNCRGSAEAQGYPHADQLCDS